ncbi:uncharacterized protein OCT59_004978 [Rhizophagus irregularis]|uniref:Uncharacterized protein n=1 Tax=Rhizophagus irregularis TaxID=588596 RepID=A0A916E036_9GLOM|nr:hypothetical protein OCT59_004978 [Rhizophagus irregularis]CAB5312852.1 unnamed protein product [Rhizophagus irregularis]
MESKLYLEVLKNLEHLFETKENYDVIIYAGEEQNQKKMVNISLRSLIFCHIPLKLFSGIYIVAKLI